MPSVGVRAKSISPVKSRPGVSPTKSVIDPRIHGIVLPNSSSHVLLDTSNSQTNEVLSSTDTQLVEDYVEGSDVIRSQFQKNL
jgi:hypothetical protein